MISLSEFSKSLLKLFIAYVISFVGLKENEIGEWLLLLYPTVYGLFIFRHLENHNKN